MTAARYVELVARGAGVQADVARRTIAGVVAPWNVYANVSTGQRIAFAPGSLTMGDRVKLVLDHDPTQPVGVLASAHTSEAGQSASFKIPGGPRGDAALLEASEGLRDGLSVGADIVDATESDQGLYVTAARVRHVALLSEPAYDDARVTTVAAAAPPPSPERALMTTLEHTDTSQSDTRSGGATVPGSPAGTAVVAAGGGSTATAAPTPPPATTAVPNETLTVTAAGHAASVPQVHVGREPYPYARPHHLGGPSFVRDAFAAMEDGGSDGAQRWRRAQAMAVEAAPSALVLLDAPPPNLAAATGTTVTDPGLVPPHWMPERFVPIVGAKAPLYTSLTKYGTPDFNTIMVPRTTAETGLSTKPADEVTEPVSGTITTASDTIVIEEVEGAYDFSRKLLMGSNPQIDRIASDAMDRAWLADVETRATTFFTTPANSTPFASTYSDGLGYVTALRAVFAQMAAATLYDADVVIPASKEYIEAAESNDTTGRPMLPFGPRFNAPGDSGAGYQSLTVQGVPLLPGPYMVANKSLVIDQEVAAAVAWVTPIMNFRLEWTGDGNVKVLRLVKYSGVGFWAQHVGGVVCMTNSTPLTLAAGAGADEEPGRGNGK